MTNSDGEFIKKVTNGDNIHKVYKMIYGIDKSKASELIKEPEIKQSITEQLSEQGITLKTLNKTLKEQLKAKKAITVSKDSHIEYVIDNQAIDNALTKGYKLYGVLKDNNNTIIDNRSITFNGNIEQLADVVKEIKQLKEQSTLDTDGEVI